MDEIIRWKCEKRGESDSGLRDKKGSEEMERGVAQDGRNALVRRHVGRLCEQHAY